MGYGILMSVGRGDGVLVMDMAVGVGGRMEGMMGI
jgi:hypothetical protein